MNIKLLKLTLFAGIVTACSFILCVLGCERFFAYILYLGLIGLIPAVLIIIRIMLTILWKILKRMVYEVTYVISKAINDGKRNEINRGEL